MRVRWRIGPLGLEVGGWRQNKFFYFASDLKRSGPPASNVILAKNAIPQHQQQIGWRFQDARLLPQGVFSQEGAFQIIIAGIGKEFIE